MRDLPHFEAPSTIGPGGTPTTIRTHTISDAPERIWAEPYDGQTNNGRWTAKPRSPELPTQYVRADSYEQLQAENAALKSAIEGIQSTVEWSNLFELDAPQEQTP